MPGSFISTGGCLFSFLAWAGIFMGIVTAIISSVISILAKKKYIVVIARVLMWLTPVLAVLLILSDYFFLSDVRDSLSSDLAITNTLIDPFRYLPPYSYDGYYQLSFPTMAEANTTVLELRIITAIFITACLAAFLSTLRNSKTDAKNKIVGWKPSVILGWGGLVIIAVCLFFAFR